MFSKSSPSIDSRYETMLLCLSCARTATCTDQQHAAVLMYTNNQQQQQHQPLQSIVSTWSLLKFHQTTYFLCCRLTSTWCHAVMLSEGTVALGVMLCMCVCVCVCPPSCLCHVLTACSTSLGGKGNVLYPVLSSYFCFQRFSDFTSFLSVYTCTL